jgi:hypothetical protein
MKAVYSSFIPVIAVCLMGLGGSCDIRRSDADPASSYNRIYDNGNANLAFYPVDMEQTDDGGFLILSVYTDTTLSTFPLIYLTKTNPFGDPVWEQWIDKSYCSAIPSLFHQGSQYDFICMDAVNQETRVMQIDLQNKDVQEIQAFSRQYPLFSLHDKDGNHLILNFDRVGRKSILTKYDAGFNEIWSTDFAILDDLKHQIELHLRKSGMQYPFFIGTVDEPNLTHYFVNCFYNYTMTLLFVDATHGTQTGTLYTYQDDAAVSAAVSIENNHFALTRYYSGDNFVNPSVDLSLSSIQSVTDFPDNPLQELSTDAPVRGVHASINGKDEVIFASQTRTNQLVLYFYDAGNGNLAQVKFLNEKYPVNLASLKYTDEKGLALLTQTFVIGRFPRASLIKLSPNDLK